MSEVDLEIPLFPLNTVLFPGGPLNLRVFEVRYLDMIRDCVASGERFGVVMRHENDTFASVGTLAKIEDYYTTDEGLLGVLVRGHERFKCVATRQKESGLWIGEVQLLVEPFQTVPPESSLLVSVAERLVEHLAERYPEAAPQDFDDAGWVGYRLGEILPLQLNERQSLLELDAPLSRLNVLQEMLPRFQSEE